MMWQINLFLIVLISMTAHASGNSWNIYKDGQPVKTIVYDVTDKFKCINCDTDTDGRKCLSEPFKLKEYCDSSVNQCYTFLNGTSARRGCVGDDQIKVEEACLNENCKICSDGPFCNSLPLGTEQCFSHVDQNDYSNEKLFSHTCSPSIEPMGCYHHIDSIGAGMRKGCVSELFAEKLSLCQQNGPDCKICFGENCNFKYSFETCVICDSESNSNCTSPNDTVETKECNKYDDRCFTYVGNNTVRRGCLGETSEEFISACRSNDAKCSLCFSKKSCNDKPVTDTCIACDSATNPNCIDSPKNSSEIICSIKDQFRVNGCYLRKNGDNVTRGCVGDLSHDDASRCRWRVADCQICKRKNCNVKKDFHQKCLFCNSKDDIDCVHGKGNASISCSYYFSSCLVGIDSRGITYRECSSKLADDERTYSNGSEICRDDDYCNNQIYPADRKLCYQCNGCDSVSNITSKPCQTFSNEEMCFAFIDHDNKVHRGCLSDESDERTLCKKHDERCKMCADSSCNDFEKHHIASGVELSTKISILTLMAPILWVGLNTITIDL